MGCGRQTDELERKWPEGNVQLSHNPRAVHTLSSSYRYSLPPPLPPERKEAANLLWGKSVAGGGVARFLPLNPLMTNNRVVVYDVVTGEDLHLFPFADTSFFVTRVKELNRELEEAALLMRISFIDPAGRLPVTCLCYSNSNLRAESFTIWSARLRAVVAVAGLPFVK